MRLASAGSFARSRVHTAAGVQRGAGTAGSLHGKPSMLRMWTPSVSASMRNPHRHLKPNGFGLSGFGGTRDVETNRTSTLPVADANDFSDRSARPLRST